MDSRRENMYEAKLNSPAITSVQNALIIEFISEMSFCLRKLVDINFHLFREKAFSFERKVSSLEATVLPLPQLV